MRLLRRRALHHDGRSFVNLRYVYSLTDAARLTRLAETRLAETRLAETRLAETRLALPRRALPSMRRPGWLTCGIVRLAALFGQAQGNAALQNILKQRTSDGDVKRFACELMRCLIPKP